MMQKATLTFSFFKDAARELTSGGKLYKSWIAILFILFTAGAFAYAYQLRYGLAVTAMNDIVSWGLYISNFAFLVGLAAAGVMLVLPAYIYKDTDIGKAVIIGEAFAASAVIMCIAFVTVDMGSPQKLFHMVPVIGIFNWPSSLLTWDVVVLNGYLALNILIPFYILLKKYSGEKPKEKNYFPWVVVSIFWAVAIHITTAFLFAAFPARPYWNSALLGPKFLASAFASGTAIIILILGLLNKYAGYKIGNRTIDKIALITAASAQINIIMLGSELFKDFYFPTEHSSSLTYLLFGLDGHSYISFYMKGALILNVIVTLILTISPLRRNRVILYLACAALFLAIWFEKGLGLIVPGFIPSFLGDVVEYWPSRIEVLVTLGIWALGFMIFTGLAKVAIAVENRVMKAE